MGTEHPGIPTTDRNGPAAAGVARALRKRAEQQRGQFTRATILKAALAEFAEKGFDGASIRSIAERTGLQHQLIIYHYPNKDRLWRAVAEATFDRIRQEWDEQSREDANLAPLDRLRAEYRALFLHSSTRPEFHRFMRQETSANNPRLQWVAENVLTPLINRLLPQIEAAQAEKLLPPVEPILFHYMMVSLTAALSEFGPEMRATGLLTPDRGQLADAYWALVERAVFAIPIDQ